MELDYEIEAFNARKLARNLESIEGVGVPGVYEELSTRRVLTLEYIDGVKITDRAALDTAGVDREQVMRSIMRATAKMLLVDGFFHADPHPGNVLVNLDTGGVTFIDTGMVGRLTREQRIALIRLLVVGRDEDVAGFAKTLQGLSTPFREVDEPAFYRDFENRVSRFLEPGKESAFADAMSTALDVLRDHGLRMDAQLTLAVKAMAQASVIVSVLRPGSTINDFLELGLEQTQELIAEQATSERLAREAKRRTTSAALDVAEKLPRLRQGVERWLEHLESGEITLKLDTSDLERQVQAASDVSRMVSIGLILGGILVGSAVAASVGSLGGPFLDFLPKFALVAYIVALAIGVVAVLGLAWGQYRRRRRGSG